MVDKQRELIGLREHGPMADSVTLVVRGELDDDWLTDTTAIVDPILTRLATFKRAVVRVELDDSGSAEKSILDAVHAADLEGSTAGFVVSPTVSRVLRSNPGGLRSPLQSPVLDPAKVVLADSGTADVERSGVFGSRVDVFDERYAATPWRRIRFPQAPSEADLSTVSSALGGWISRLEFDHSGPPGSDALALTAIVPESVVTRAEFAMYEVERFLAEGNAGLMNEDFTEITRLCELILDHLASRRSRKGIVMTALNTLAMLLTIASGSEWAAGHSASTLEVAQSAIQAALDSIP